MKNKIFITLKRSMIFFFNQLNIKDQTQCVKLFTNNKNGKAMFQKAFQKYIEKENIENLEIE